jgi:hypothetical protein
LEGQLSALSPNKTIKEARGQAGSVYGTRLYEVMRYWDEDHAEWDAPRRAFATALIR